MSSTHRPSEALEAAKSYVKNMPLERVGAGILDDIHQIMWTAAPWRWTVGIMPSASLVSNQQDYSITLPGDFLYAISSHLSDGVTTPQELKIEPTLPATLVQGVVSRIAILGVNPSAVIRVAPVPGDQPANEPIIISLYKKKAPIISVSNMSTAGTQVFDDEWFWVFREGVLWKAYQWADDARAGGVTIAANGQAQFSGQRANFENALLYMKQNEKLSSEK